MKKLLTGIAALLLAACFSAAALANPGWGEGRGHKFAPERQAKRLEFMAEKNKLRADFLKGEVAAGRMSKQTADAHIALMEDHLARIREGGPGRRAFSAEEREAARAAKLDYFNKVRELEIKSVKQSVAAGLIDEERGKRIIERIENTAGEYEYRRGGCRRGYDEERDGYGGCDGYYGRGGRHRGYYR